ncbi:transposase [Streptomyces lanatus]|uniref:Transposase n=1 Tax=Streptomyces lanatus TaxID=66900 RepID=A0ABV1XXG6_9ACTN|nr:transposase [Streptomyces lanatus]GHH17214.1 transposase [Streptomyces lanatus]
MDAANSAFHLDHFSRTIFSSLRRTDQRKWAYAYLNGLLVTQGKKSIRRLAATIPSDPTAAQSLRWFVSLSPWDFDLVMEELTHWVAHHRHHRHRTESVWTVGRAILPKRGDRSVGVHRYFDLSSGRTVNCQLGLGSFLCVGTARVPVDWCLYLSPSWTEDRDQRREARIPDSEVYRPLWAHALRLVDRLSARTDSSSAVVLSDMGDEPDVGHLLNGLARRRRDFVIAIPPHLPVLPVGDGVMGGAAPGSAKALLSSGSPEDTVVTLSDGRQRVARLQTSLIHLPGVRKGPPYRLFAEVDDDGAPGPVWLTSLAHSSLARVASIVALNAETQAVIGCMERDFGLLDFEGRSLPGWYHHMALVSAAYTYHRLSGLTQVSSHDGHRGRQSVSDLRSSSGASMKSYRPPSSVRKSTESEY